MNVSIVLARGLTEAVGGRSTLELGLPEGSDVGDVFDALLSLYPQLRRYFGADTPGTLAASATWAGGKLYLFAHRAARLGKPQ